MKKTFAVFLLAALTLTVLAGCQSANAENTVPDSVSATSLIPQDQYEGQITKTDAPEAVLSAREAEAAALAHAGIKAEDARMERTELDRDEKLPHYEVEFSSGDYEYDYEINAATGEVLHWDKEYDPPKPAPTAPPATEPPVTQPEATLLTEEEAEAAALAHAGLAAGEVRFDRTEKDREKGVPVYEVEFRAGNWEYSYEIHAETGKILEWEKEYDD